MAYIARASAATLTVTPTGGGTGFKKGPSHCFVYGIMGGGVVAPGTTGMTIQVANGDGTVLLLRHFATPVSTSINFNGFIDLGPVGVLFDTSLSAVTPDSIVVTLGQTGTAITSPQLEVYYDFV